MPVRPPALREPADSPGAAAAGAAGVTDSSAAAGAAGVSGAGAAFGAGAGGAAAAGVSGAAAGSGAAASPAAFKGPRGPSGPSGAGAAGVTDSSAAAGAAGFSGAAASPAVAPAALRGPGGPGASVVPDSPGVPGAAGRFGGPGAAGPRGRGEAGPPEVGRPASSDAAELPRIAAEIRECRDCNLHLTRENTVPGYGPADCLLMVVTPAPGDSAAENDSPLPPFEHEYLWKWLTALELRPGPDVFITPAVKCRTPGGRPPLGTESAACAGYLHRQYRAAAPRAVLALGASACASLTGSPADFPALVGRQWNWGGVPALVLWTPAEVLANPARLRSPVWESLKRLKAAWNALS